MPMKPYNEIAYGKTAMGQLLYDLAFTKLSARYIARKHHLPIASVRQMSEGKEIKKLRRQNRLPAMAS
jgi:hypothetical protein